ncbi:MAG: sigma-54-dependent Fis family transcriptional regulator [Deltaproteobacteria bacterium HGW-Deltaproteobacteria-15]|jgi:transcriptional regulator with PAS, ATPase and Fis domain|nr:MAG: sigma-54-dependent Fis family transcriptional regulator [Deltaproteobacteria bacterium HGW-Deltaproteobacteria-15]
MKKLDERVLFTDLALVCEEIAKGRYKRAKQLFELTKEEKYPSLIARLAESFGMMMVKVEAREYHLEGVIENLRNAQKELAASRNKLAEENVNLRWNLREKFSPSGILGTSKGIGALLTMVEKVSHVSANVLITGETGTGKELVAKAIHYNSPRADKPFVAINCSAVPEPIFESEIFGIEKGVATGVDKRMGKIEQAQGGTLFLDEIADMPFACQAKMLRVIEEERVEPVGARKSIPVDVRILAATNKELRTEAEKGGFREDLFYRLHVINLHIPPLRERREDIRLLASHFLLEAVRRFGRDQMSLSPQAMDKLMAYSWPGNVRELRNEIERAVILAPSREISPDDLSQEVRADRSAGPSEAGLSVRANEKELIRKALADSGGNRSEAARLLGISREGLRKKMKRYGIQ